MTDTDPGACACPCCTHAVLLRCRSFERKLLRFQGLAVQLLDDIGLGSQAAALREQLNEWEIDLRRKFPLLFIERKPGAVGKIFDTALQEGLMATITKKARAAEQAFRQRAAEDSDRDAEGARRSGGAAKRSSAGAGSQGQVSGSEASAAGARSNDDSIEFDDARQTSSVVGMLARELEKQVRQQATMRKLQTEGRAGEDDAASNSAGPLRGKRVVKVLTRDGMEEVLSTLTATAGAGP